ncbi:MAG: chemotaxis protein CheW [Wenzhouxiangellaceae bacterium]|nr:chemotaxis protein CheW [Wenzhouxiangellaceae bacterium]
MAANPAQTLFGLLADFERRSIDHDVTSSSQRDSDSNWDGVVFRLGDHRLTVGITEVDEILPLPAATPVPGSADWLLGMANVRGNLVTVVDLGWFLFGSRTPITARTRVILTRLQGRYLGLIVDEVFGQRHFNVNDLAPLDDADEAGARDDDAERAADRIHELVRRVFPQGDERWGLFQINQLMTDARFLDGSA